MHNWFIFHDSVLRGTIHIRLCFCVLSQGGACVSETHVPYDVQVVVLELMECEGVNFEWSGIRLGNNS